jgi:ribonuclease G
MSTEILVERGIGASRALVVDGGVVVAAHFERDDDGPAAGAVHVARLTKILEPGRRGIMRLGDHEGLVEPLPYCPEGGLLRVEVTRAALHEAGRPRLAKLRNIEGDAVVEGEVRAGPDLAARLAGQGRLVRLSGIGEDRLEAAGWSETVEAARSGHVAFAGGLLTISPTPAMTVIDIDGPGDPEALALAAAGAVAAAIARFDIQGSIGIDFPTLEGKAARARIGELLDAALPAPFERTAVNGWGFVQIVRPRRRAGFVEAVRAPGFAALELLRRAARSGAGNRTLAAHPAVIGWLERHPALVAELARGVGGDIALHADPALAMVAGDVHG